MVRYCTFCWNILVVISYFAIPRVKFWNNNSSRLWCGGRLGSVSSGFNQKYQKSTFKFDPFSTLHISSHLELSCDRALLMCSGKTLSASQGLDSMTHRRSNIDFRYFWSHALLSVQLYIWTWRRCASVRGMVATRTTHPHVPLMPTIQGLEKDQMSPLQMVSPHQFCFVNMVQCPDMWLVLKMVRTGMTFVPDLGFITYFI